MYHLHTTTRSQWLLQNSDFLLTTLPKRINIDAIKFSHLKVIMITLFRANSSHRSNKQRELHTLCDKDLQANSLLAGQSNCP